MFGINYSELLVIAMVALVVIGPKDLPRVMRQVGRWIGKAQGMARHFRSGIDTMIREAELEDLEKKWREENERIMREHPLMNPGAEMLPLAAPGSAAPPAEAAWEPPAETAPVPDAPAPARAAAVPDPNAPELPLGPPSTGDRELP
jgi:sec-independent protein translocase protein TatB